MVEGMLEALAPSQAPSLIWISELLRGVTPIVWLWSGVQPVGTEQHLDLCRHSSGDATTCVST